MLQGGIFCGNGQLRGRIGVFIAEIAEKLEFGKKEGISTGIHYLPINSISYKNNYLDPENL